MRFATPTREHVPHAIALARPMEATTVAGYAFRETDRDELQRILPLENALIGHLRARPAFFPVRENTAGAFDARNDGARLFVARHGADIAGACFLPEHRRGGSVYTALLAHVATTLRTGGYRGLCFDDETMNPAARHFREKSFAPYTCGYVRRINDGILEFAP